ncbi:transposase [Desertivirga xinjiangensis]|uniref:transposase n=1 Tax=Desertivirga xinjiangensis TaxID=539206 RepID=UPI00210AAD9D|nr:transposase [Pedobacter xinjiangensis]
MAKTKYSKKLVDVICELYAKGEHSIKDICKMAGISKDTFFEWKKNNADFSDRLKGLEDDRLENYAIMARSGLAKLLDVHEYEEVTTEYVTDPDGKPIVKHQKRVKKKVMPNATAVIFALTNRDPDNWKHKQEMDVTTKGESLNKGLQALSEEELLKRAKELSERFK